MTASAGWPDDALKTGAQYDLANGFYSGLGLDFYDLHAYSDTGTFPGADALCSRAAADGVPVYLGEFGQQTHRLDDQLQYDATSSFLRNAKALCFKGAFAWRFDAAERWWSFVAVTSRISLVPSLASQPACFATNASGAASKSRRSLPSGFLASPGYM